MKAVNEEHNRLVPVSTNGVIFLRLSLYYCLSGRILSCMSTHPVALSQQVSIHERINSLMDSLFSPALSLG